MAEPSIKGFFTLRSKEGFVLLNPEGIIPDDDSSPCGVVWRNMRHVGKCEPRLAGRKLAFRDAWQDGSNELHFSYANEAFTDGDGRDIPAGALCITRSLTMTDGRVHEKFTLENNGTTPVKAELSYRTEAGFDDIFDIRSVDFLSTPSAQRKKRGMEDAPVTVGRIHSQHYEWKNGKGGNDAEWRFSLTPEDKGGGVLAVTLSAGPGESQSSYVSYGPARPGGADENAEKYDRACEAARKAGRKLLQYGPSISSDDPAFNRVLDRSFHDLSMLTADLETGPYPFAGMPWFCVPFGRDALVTSLLLLPFYPDLARGVLKLQADRQAKSQDLFRQAEPGKIFHEMRHGSETASLGENPFEFYYGGVDTTPLFVFTAGEYYKRTERRDFIEGVWPEIKAALGWITGNMDENGGYVRYRYHKNGLTQQGWKDSGDSVFHADAPGVLPPDPIALCEVQALAYGALRAGARFADMMGDADSAADWTARAGDLHRRYNADFWQPHMNTYALALDGKNRPCEVATSNAGYGLLTGIVPGDRAFLLAETLMGSKSFSGFGIRTLAEGPGYDPLSYHRGSVWPHDTAMVAMGLGAYGFKKEAAEIMKGLIAAAADDPRLPELFSGAARIEGQPKEPYPSACAPQAWAAASVYGVLGACLRPQFDLAAKTVDVSDATPPPEAGTITIRKWPIGGDHKTVTIAP